MPHSSREYNKELKKRTGRRLRAIFNDYKLKEGCRLCGYNKCAVALQLHHTDPKSKARIMRGKGFHRIIGKWSNERVWNEVKACIVVCGNCHAEIHEGLHPEYLIESAVADSKDPPEQLGLVFG